MQIQDYLGFSFLACAFLYACYCLGLCCFVYSKQRLQRKCKPLSQLSDKHILIIGLCGKKGSGKDTVGNYLVENYGFVRIAFADPLKEACKIVFGFSQEQLHGNKKETPDGFWIHTPREIMQVVGTELFRKELPKHCKYIDDNIWINAANKKLQELQKKGHKRFVFTDVRFNNEARSIMNKKGVKSMMWNISRLYPSGGESHESEAGIDSRYISKCVRNMGTFENLFEKIDRLM